MLKFQIGGGFLIKINFKVNLYSLNYVYFLQEKNYTFSKYASLKSGMETTLYPCVRYMIKLNESKLLGKVAFLIRKTLLFLLSNDCEILWSMTKFKQFNFKEHVIHSSGWCKNIFRKKASGTMKCSKPTHCGVAKIQINLPKMIGFLVLNQLGKMGFQPQNQLKKIYYYIIALGQVHVQRMGKKNLQSTSAQYFMTGIKQKKKYHYHVVYDYQ